MTPRRKVRSSWRNPSNGPKNQGNFISGDVVGESHLCLATLPISDDDAVFPPWSLSKPDPFCSMTPPKLEAQRNRDGPTILAVAHMIGSMIVGILGSAE